MTHFSLSEEQKAQHKSIFKTDIDKHVLTSAFNFKGLVFNNYTMPTWFTFLPHYSIHLETQSPPPRPIS